MPQEDEIHQCKVLELESKYLEYCCEGQRNARWRLIWDIDGCLSNDQLDEVFMQRVLFCPGCGKDLRKDTAISV